MGSFHDDLVQACSDLPDAVPSGIGAGLLLGQDRHGSSLPGQGLFRDLCDHRGLRLFAGQIRAALRLGRGTLIGH